MSPLPSSHSCGIDFGTSNSTVSVASAADVRVIPAGAGSAPTVPSVIYLHRDGTSRAGRGAEETFFTSGHRRTDCLRCSLARYGVSTCLQFRRGGGCNDSRLLWAVKRDLAKSEFTGTNSWARDFPPAGLVAVVIGHLKSAAEAAAGEALGRVVLGHPVVFPSAAGRPDVQRLGLERLVAAARLAGFEEVELYPEPAAAGLAGSAEVEGLTVTLDFGGGTFDVAVMRVDEKGARTLALTGAAVGGERLDEVVFELAVGPALGLQGLPNWLYNEMRSLSRVMLLLSDPGLPVVLDRWSATHDSAAAGAARRILFGGFAYDFYKEIEAAKIRLSTEAATEIAFSRDGLRLRSRLSRAVFEAAVRPELDEVESAVIAALQLAGVAPAEVDSVVLTGGSSQIPVFRRRVEGLFPGAHLRARDAFTSVVEGLGLRARQVWGQAQPA